MPIQTSGHPLLPLEGDIGAAKIGGVAGEGPRLHRENEREDTYSPPLHHTGPGISGGVGGISGVSLLPLN